MHIEIHRYEKNLHSVHMFSWGLVTDVYMYSSLLKIYHRQYHHTVPTAKHVHVFVCTRAHACVFCSLLLGYPNLKDPYLVAHQVVIRVIRR